MTQSDDAGIAGVSEVRSDGSGVARQKLPVDAKADPALRDRHPERLVVVAFGQGDLGAENGSPAGDRDRRAAHGLRPPDHLPPNFLGGLDDQP